MLTGLDTYVGCGYYHWAVERALKMMEVWIGGLGLGGFALFTCRA